MTATFASHRSKAAQLPRWIQRVLDALRRSHRQGAFGAITEAAYRGNTAAQMVLAADYHEGRSVPPSKQAAADWLKRAAAGRNPDAMVQLAKLALAGDLPPHRGPALFPWLQAQPLGPSFDQARLWAQRAVAAGSQEGKVLLATILAQGPPEWQDDAASRTLLDHAAAAGNPSAAFVLAIQHAQQRSADPATIAGLLRVGADAGLPAASYLYGIATETGAGCLRDAVAAAIHYRNAAERGFVWAQARLGHALIHGTGTEPNAFQGRNMAAHGRTRRKQRGRGVTG